MRVRITRLDPTIPLPEHKTAGAVAFDIAPRVNTVVASGATVRIPTGLIIKTPPGYALIIVSRSSTPERKGLLLPNGIGILDQDYCGPTDELHLLVYNFTEAPVTVKKGERIAQGLFVPIERAEWDEGPAAATSRGGFGSTGI